MSDNINPDHYRIEGRKECIDEIREEFGDTLTMGFCLGSAKKYRYRAGRKNDNALEDIEKAQWYEQMAVHLFSPDRAPDPRVRKVHQCPIHLVEEEVNELCLLQREAWQVSEDHGFHDSARAREPLVKIALVHAELSELTEVIRQEGWSQIDCPKDIDITAAEEEVADAIIRLLDFAEMFGLDVGRAVRLKMDYNKGRPHKHGKEV